MCLFWWCRILHVNRNGMMSFFSLVFFYVIVFGIDSSILWWEKCQQICAESHASELYTSFCDSNNDNTFLIVSWLTWFTDFFCWLISKINFFLNSLNIVNLGKKFSLWTKIASKFKASNSATHIHNGENHSVSRGSRNSSNWHITHTHKYIFSRIQMSCRFYHTYFFYTHNQTVEESRLQPILSDNHSEFHILFIFISSFVLVQRVCVFWKYGEKTEKKCALEFRVWDSSNILQLFTLDILIGFTSSFQLSFSQCC